MGNPKLMLSQGMSYLFGGVILFTTMLSIYSTYQISQQHEQNFSLWMKIEKTEKETAAKILSLREELNQLKTSFYENSITLNQQFTNKMSTFREQTQAIVKEQVEKSVQSDQQASELNTEKRISDLRVDIKGIQKDVEAVSPLISQVNQLKDSLNQVNQSVILLQATKTQGENNDLVHTNDLSNLSNEMNDMNKIIFELKYDLTEVKAKLNMSGSISSDSSNFALKSDIETVKTSIQQDIQSVRNSITSHEFLTYGPFIALHPNLFIKIDTKAIYPIPTREPCIIEIKQKSHVSLSATGFGHFPGGAAYINFLINRKTNLPGLEVKPHILYGAGFLYNVYLPIYHKESFVLEPGTYEFTLGVTCEEGSGEIEFNIISFVASVIS